MVDAKYKYMYINSLLPKRELLLSLTKRPSIAAIKHDALTKACLLQPVISLLTNENGNNEIIFVCSSASHRWHKIFYSFKLGGFIYICKVICTKNQTDSSGLKFWVCTISVEFANVQNVPNSSGFTIRHWHQCSIASVSKSCWRSLKFDSNITSPAVISVYPLGLSQNLTSAIQGIWLVKKIPSPAGNIHNSHTTSIILWTGF